MAKFKYVEGLPLEVWQHTPRLPLCKFEACNDYIVDASGELSKRLEDMGYQKIDGRKKKDD